MSDWDAIIGEAALGLDLARLDAVREGPVLVLARPAPPEAASASASAEDGTSPRPSLRLASRPEFSAIDPDAIFREEALEFRARGRDLPGAVVRLGSSWLSWAYRVTLTLVVVAVASMWVIRTTESTSGPVAVDGRTGLVAMLIPAAAGADLTGSSGLTVVLPDGRSIQVTGLHAVLADDAAIRNAGFTPLSQPALLVTGQAGTGAPGAPAAPVRAHATVVLRSETVADVLARQFDAMLGQGTAP